MVVGFVVFFLFFFVRGFMQQRQKQRIDELQRDVEEMRIEAARRQLHQEQTHR